MVRKTRTEKEGSCSFGTQLTTFTPPWLHLDPGHLGEHLHVAGCCAPSYRKVWDIPRGLLFLIWVPVCVCVSVCLCKTWRTIKKSGWGQGKRRCCQGVSFLLPVLCQQFSPSAQCWAAAPAHRAQGAYLLTHSYLRVPFPSTQSPLSIHDTASSYSWFLLIFIWTQVPELLFLPHPIRLPPWCWQLGTVNVPCFKEVETKAQGDGRTKLK